MTTPTRWAPKPWIIYRKHQSLLYLANTASNKKSMAQIVVKFTPILLQSDGRIHSVLKLGVRLRSLT